jgi:dynactin 1
MRVAIEDLEALKELNDELEENHVEAEKQLNEEIGENRQRRWSLRSLRRSDNLTGQLRDERSRSADLDGVVLDMEATILQFRELIAGLQR